MKKEQKTYEKFYRPLIGTALVGTSLFQLGLPVLAAGTLAGTTISNEASASYNDTNGDPYTTTSNQVDVIVDEVAGIEVLAVGITDVNTGSVQTGDTLFYDFRVTNTGNDGTFIDLPAAADLATVGLNAGTLTAQIISVNGTPLGAPIDVTAGGSTEALLAADFPTGTGGIGQPGEIESEDTFTVRITATVTETVATNPVSVQYGDTPPNDNSAATQNQPASNGVADVNTLDVGDGLSGEPVGAPVNGEREAAAFLRTNLSTQVRNVALLTVEKTRLTQTVNNPASATDDQLLYRLDATVESTSLNGGFQPAALEGTTINVDGTPGTYVLIADAVPVGTVIDQTFDVNANLPTGWVAVFTTDPTTTPATTATWTSAAVAAPFIPNTATRVGFVYDTAANGVIPLGGSTQTATPDLLNDPGLFFQVVTSGLPASGGSVNNIAQGFGETAGDPTNEIIYDESGDQKPNNFNDDNTPPDPTGSNYNPAVDTGVANPATQGTDPGNNNTGTGPKGEDNVIVVTPATPPSLGLFNGPDQAPQAIGPTTDQDDFTNQSTPVDGAVPGDPDPEVFNNTVNNPPTNSSQIDNVTLRPIRPSLATTATPGGEDYGVDTDIPDGTRVTITNDAGTVSAVYDYDSVNGFVLNAPLSTGLGGALNNFEDLAVNIGTLPLGGSADYTVTVDLPPGTPELSSVSIPIVAYPENTQDSGFDPTADTVFNFTIDRLYTGFMQVAKDVTIFEADGVTPANGGVGNATDNVVSLTGGVPTTPNPTYNPKPTDILEYTITYRNISEEQTGNSLNVVLSATDFIITEDGTTGTPNNWATDIDDLDGDADPTSGIDTSNVIGSASGVFTDGVTPTTVTFAPGGDQTGTDQAGDVTVYTNDTTAAGIITPQTEGTFTFRRVVN